jgi:hypothetical protein
VRGAARVACGVAYIPRRDPPLLPHCPTNATLAGRPELRNLDPFLMLDNFDVRLPANFQDHPHRELVEEFLGRRPAARIH